MKTLYDIFIKMINKIKKEAQVFVDTAITKENIKQVFVKHVVAVGTNHYKIIIGDYTYDMNADSWKMARKEGLTFFQMLERVWPETCWYLYQLAVQNNISEINITSLYRPLSGVHSIGIAVDIGHIIFQDNSQIWYYNSGNTFEPKTETKLRKWAWKSGLLNQYIGPFYHRGTLGWKTGWHKNHVRKNVNIEWQHRHHLHMTIRTGR